MSMHTSSNTSFLTPCHLIQLAWYRRGKLIYWGICMALLALAVFFLIPWKTSYQMLLRIEPELSTTGETTSIEAEIEVIQSWDTIALTAQKLNRNIDVKPVVSRSLMQLGYYVGTLVNLYTGTPTLKSYTDYQPSIRIDHFTISGNEADYAGTQLYLKYLQQGSYELLDENGAFLMEGKTGKPMTVEYKTKAGAHELRILVSGVSAHPGQRFAITVQPAERYIRSLQSAMSISRKGYRERSGVMEVNFTHPDPVFARQFLEALKDIYIAKAYDRSSLGKLQGLDRLQKESVVLRSKLAAAKEALAAFKDSNRTVNLQKEQDSAYARKLELQTELANTMAHYKELQVSFTEQHPTVMALRNRTAYLRGEIDTLEKQLGDMPQKEQELDKLLSEVTIAQAMLDANIALAAKLRAEVETITGYARLVSLHQAQETSLMLRSLGITLLGFACGVLLALSQLLVTTVLRAPQEEE